MGAYNVINPGTIQAGQPEDVSQVLANLNAIAAVLNGNIDNTNLAAGILASKLAGYPADATKFLKGDGTWAAPAIYTPITYRKTTPKAVNTTAAETDLLNGEITLAALTASNVVKITAVGDYLNNTGGLTSSMRWKLKLGATTLIDTNSAGNGCLNNSAVRNGWRMSAVIQNLGLTNSQLVEFELQHIFLSSNTANNNGAEADFLTGAGAYSLLTTTTFTTSQAFSRGLWAQGYNATAVDTTIANLLSFTVINPSALATFETKLLGALVEII